MTVGEQLREGQVLEGPLFSEPVRVETLRPNGIDTWEVGLVGVQTDRFRRVTLSTRDLASLRVLQAERSFAGDGKLLVLGLQALALGIAYEFDPYFGLSISRVDPLPHQLEAVYEFLLKTPRVRFLLADDAGAGKTIMAGLLIRELKLRGLAERIAIVCPANLAFQWQREMREKFDETFQVLRGDSIREQFGVNQWLEQRQVITSLDLAKRTDILPGLRQVHWDLVVVDEAHRMSASDPEHKTQRYRLGELLRDTTDHYLLLTATPHRGDPENFSFFLQLLDADAYADVKSIRQAMERRYAPFYIRRTKEAMVYFPERQEDGTWAARPVFTKRIPHSADFEIEGAEFELYRDVTSFVRRKSYEAAAQDDPRGRAVGFLMSLYQRRVASSAYAIEHSLKRRAKRLRDLLQKAEELAETAPPTLPSVEDLEEMEEAEREQLELRLEAVTLTRNRQQVLEEAADLDGLADRARAVQETNAESKLSKLRQILQKQGFFDDPDQRLLIFTEFKDTLDYLRDRLKEWGFRVGVIHGSMKAGSRDQPGTRLFAEQQFWDGATQVMVATEAAGEGINLQCCHVMFNYDIPWNPNRLEQRMGRIHRYGQKYDCLIFNFVATNTVEGGVLKKLLDKLQEIRDALDDDSVFNVVGEILPAAQVERVLRDYYAGRLGLPAMEERLLRDVQEDRFRAIVKTALEGLATNKLNLEMLVERRARAQEHRVVPETVFRFLQAAAPYVGLNLRSVPSLPFSFEPSGPTPATLSRFERESDWRLPPLAHRYRRCSTDRETAEKAAVEWVTPGHPLFEALRRHTARAAEDPFRAGACFYSLEREVPARLDVYRARVVDGLDHVIHQKMFMVEVVEGAEPRLRELGLLADFQPATHSPGELIAAAALPEPQTWLNKNVLRPFIDELRVERGAELDRVAEHVELSLRELISKADLQVGRLIEERDARRRGDVIIPISDDPAMPKASSSTEGVEGRLAQAEARLDELVRRRERRRQELAHQRSLTLQGVERLTSVLVLPHPDREQPDLRRLRPDPVVEAKAMRAAMDYERTNGRDVEDVSEKNLGYDLSSINSKSGELRLIEVKGVGEAVGTILLTPNERRVAQDRRDCYWLYAVTNCNSEPTVEPILDPARFPWHEVSKVDHYYLNVAVLMQLPK